MSNNVSGNNYKITLHNGKTVDIKALDKLVGKSVQNSIFASYDKVGRGGNENNIFDQQEIDKIKQEFLNANNNDGVVTQEEINQIMAKNFANEQENFDVNKLTSLIDTLEAEQAGASAPKEGENDEDQVYTTYVVQTGDTVKKIINKLGLTGEEAEKASSYLKTQLNSRGWFMVGQKVKIPGDHKAKVEELKAGGTYTENKKELQEQYRKVVGEKSSSSNSGTWENTQWNRIRTQTETKNISGGGTLTEHKYQWRKKKWHLEGYSDAACILG